ncbi:hypothetical protein E2C01_018308 [Portunus trituberculatus]|uniref:Uncharacterized protein n=1 Tax=Portunus trituberculatus TaxID=210409 RepID=A0A5B7DWH0_PORTR|nr:hypothetical protein [Portunus trituberculatus]
MCVHVAPVKCATSESTSSSSSNISCTLSDSITIHVMVAASTTKGMTAIDAWQLWQCFTANKTARSKDLISSVSSEGTAGVLLVEFIRDPLIEYNQEYLGVNSEVMAEISLKTRGSEVGVYRYAFPPPILGCFDVVERR